jgi:hypothetical protein
MTRRIRTGVLALLVAVVLGFGWTAVVAQGNQNYTCTWTNDGVLVDGYQIVVDGVATTVTATCTGSGAARTCTAPFTMSVNMNHTVTVVAFNAFGSVVSPPFSAAPPQGAVGAVTVKKAGS